MICHFCSRCQMSFLKFFLDSLFIDITALSEIICDLQTIADVDLLIQFKDKSALKIYRNLDTAFNTSSY